MPRVGPRTQNSKRQISQQLQSIGTSLGFSPQQVSTQLAELLPQVIDKLTPNGALPAAGEADLLGMLRSLGGR